MYFWISRCLHRTSTLALSKTLSAYRVFSASEKVTLLISLDVQHTPALKRSPSALLFSAHTHVATTLFKTPPAHCCAVIFRSPAGSLWGFLQLMVTKATQLHTQRDTNTSIQSVLQRLIRVSSSEIKYCNSITLNNPALSGMTLELSDHKLEPLSSVSVNSRTCFPPRAMWGVLTPAQLWPSYSFNLNTDQKLLVMERKIVHTIKGNAWSTFFGGSNLLPEVCTL